MSPVQSDYVTLVLEVKSRLRPYMSPSSFFLPPHTLEGDASLLPNVSPDIGWYRENDLFGADQNQLKVKSRLRPYMSPSSFFPPPHTLEGDASLSPSVSLDIGWYRENDLLGADQNQLKGLVLLMPMLDIEARNEPRSGVTFQIGNSNN
ncbi:hypothetical protein J6590_015011 [Homalodisca vitripennis]|nr:hypothetical protein J6590_015011 [Homalodisca vitripennis]